MYLKTLICKGFKSFADRSVLGMEPGITAIIGPNGSGKSNVLDAVLWVLGERNARNLRGQAMEDVIFAGSTTRKRVNMAEVELVLDNADGTLPVDCDEVSITRRLYRDGQGEYLINGTPCRRMDVIDILHDSGLGQGTHSIISQGHLDSVLQSRPADRRVLVEEAAGILKHKQRRARSERKLERMDQNLLRVDDINREVERQLRPLARKAKRAAAYEGLSSELAEVTLDLAVDDLRVLQRRWDDVCGQERELAELADEKAQLVQREDARVQELQASLRRRADGAGLAAERLRQLSRVTDQVDSAARLLHERKRSAARVLAERKARHDADLARLAALREQRERDEAVLLDAQRGRAAAEEAAAAADAERDEAASSLQALQRELAALERGEGRLIADERRLRAAKDKTAEALASAAADDKLLEAQERDIERRIEEAQARVEDAARHLEVAQEELDRATAADEEARREAAAAFALADDRRRELAGLRDEASRLSAATAGLEEAERLARSANAALAWSIESSAGLGAGGMLMDALRVPPDAVAIVEELLADATQALLVPDASAAATAAAAVSASGEEGTATFVASSAVGARGAVRVPTGSPGVPLVDVLDFDESVRDAVVRLLGDVVLCDDVQAARSCARAMEGAGGAWRVASKDGLIATSAGAVRSARPASGAVGVLGRHAQIEAARAASDAAAERAERAAASLAQAEESLRSAQARSLECASALAQARGAHDSASGQARRAEQDLRELKGQSAELARRHEGNRELLGRMRPDSLRLEDELARVASALAGTRADLAARREGLEPLRSKSEKLAERHAELRLQAGKLAEREAYARRVLEGARGDVARLEGRLVRNGRSAHGYLDEEGVQGVLGALSLVREAVSMRIAALEEHAAALREGDEAMHRESDEAGRRAAELRLQAEDAAARLADVRVQKGRLEVQVEAAVKTIREDCASPIERALDRPALQDRPEAESRAAALRKRMAGLGPVDPGAAREYEDLKARSDYLRAQVADITAARRSLNKVTHAIDRRMSEDFERTFQAVDANFRRIFAELFPGGQASLQLVGTLGDEDAGIEVNAQPRGKRIAKMSLMSGGEKSLTALALLFAVYATRPTPFYILDEVEAALDDTNLRRLCSFLDAMRDRTQLIMITHQRRTMEMADVLYGISMQQDGVTKVISQRLDRSAAGQEG